MSAEPLYAFFEHPNGSWYRLWRTRTTPRTAKGMPWHLHATYDKTGSIAPIVSAAWYENAYGISNWDYLMEEESVEAFLKRVRERLAHGYILRERSPFFPEEGTGSQSVHG